VGMRFGLLRVFMNFMFSGLFHGYLAAILHKFSMAALGDRIALRPSLESRLEAWKSYRIRSESEFLLNCWF
jgi:hypothetical protein